MNNKKYLLVIGSVQLQQIDTALSWPVARSPKMLRLGFLHVVNHSTTDILVVLGF